MDKSSAPEAHARTTGAGLLTNHAAVLRHARGRACPCHERRGARGVDVFGATKRRAPASVWGSWIWSWARRSARSTLAQLESERANDWRSASSRDAYDRFAVDRVARQTVVTEAASAESGNVRQSVAATGRDDERGRQRSASRGALRPCHPSMGSDAQLHCAAGLRKRSVMRSLSPTATSDWSPPLSVGGSDHTPCG